MVHTLWGSASKKWEVKKQKKAARNDERSLRKQKEIQEAINIITDRDDRTGNFDHAEIRERTRELLHPDNLKSIGSNGNTCILITRPSKPWFNSEIADAERRWKFSRLPSDRNSFKK